MFIATFSNAGAYRVYEKFHELANQYNAPNFFERIKLVQARTAVEKINFQILQSRIGPVDFWIDNRRPQNQSEDSWYNLLRNILIFVGTSDSLAMLANDVPVHGVIYDEASQLTVPQFFQVIPDNTIHSVCVVGDDQQLPPVVTLTPLSISALTYLQGVNTYQNSPIPISQRVELQHQYRMHPAIAQLTENILTNNRTIIPSGDTLNANYILQNYQQHFPSNLSTQNENDLNEILQPEHPMVIIDTSELSDALNERLLSSRRNLTEAEIAASLYYALLDNYQNLQQFDIIITAPYRPQVDLLQRRYHVRTGTTHQFQGQEADVVIYSLTFAQQDTKSDFFSKVNLMYVGLSRAKRKLIIIGNRDALNSVDYGIQHVRNTIFNYSYQPRNPGYPSYTPNPVFHFRPDDEMVNVLRRSYLP